MIGNWKRFSKNFRNSVVGCLSGLRQPEVPKLLRRCYLRRLMSWNLNWLWQIWETGDFDRMIWNQQSITYSQIKFDFGLNHSLIFLQRLSKLKSVGITPVRCLNLYESFHSGFRTVSFVSSCLARPLSLLRCRVGSETVAAEGEMPLVQLTCRQLTAAALILKINVELCSEDECH